MSIGAAINSAPIALGFGASLIVFLLIGVSSARLSRGTGDDYYLASRAVTPWLAGLSAVATNNSGYMFIGLMGYTYVAGLSSIWLMIGWIVGDFLASLLIHPQLRRASTDSGTTTFAGALARWRRDHPHHAVLQRIAALVSLVFLLAYAAAQLLAGSKALHALLDWPLWSGAALGAVLVGVYCFSGGIRASIWTDAAQSAVMIVAMVALLVSGAAALGGGAATWQQLHAVPGYMDWFPRDLPAPGAIGAVLFALSWLFAGFSVVGQPHIMVRFMALDDPHHLARARWWYYGWFIAFYSLATAVGLLARIYLAGPEAFDAELALPHIAAGVLPALWVGIVLAGIFAATMSTADSLILSCSAALTQDLLPNATQRTLLLKLSTIAITAAALLIALAGPQSVFSLVLLAWSGMASAFAPLLFVYALGGRPTQAVALAMMFGGLATAILWRQLGWHAQIYEGMPGILAGLCIYLFDYGYRRCLSRYSINTPG